MIVKKSLSCLLFLKNKNFILQDSKRLKTFQVPQEKDIPQVPKQIFQQALLMSLIRLQTAFQKLKQSQPDESQSNIKSIQFSGLKKLQVQSSQGMFLFEGNQEISTFFYSSPFTGTYKYYYSIGQRQWKSNKDDHIMQENVSRQIQGKFYSYLQL